MLRYAYYPGCVAQGACRELYISTGALAQKLGIELIELKKAACCGSGTYKEDSQLLEDTINARNIALAEELSLPLLTHCSTCQGVLGHVDERLKRDQRALGEQGPRLERVQCVARGVRHRRSRRKLGDVTKERDVGRGAKGEHRGVDGVNPGPGPAARTIRDHRQHCCSRTGNGGGHPPHGTTGRPRGQRQTI